MAAATLERVVSGETVRLRLPGVAIADLQRKSTGGAATEARYVERLRSALESGLDCERDPRRENFFEAEVCGYRYYFAALYLNSGQPKVLLLAARQAD